MTALTPPSPARPITPELLRSLVAALPQPAGEPEKWRRERFERAKTAVAALAPRDAIEAMLAVQVVATQAAVMECYRQCTMPGATEEVGRRHRATAVALMRSATATLQMLKERQSQPLPAPAELPQISYDELELEVVEFGSIPPGSNARGQALGLTAHAAALSRDAGEGDGGETPCNVRTPSDPTDSGAVMREAGLSR